VVLKISLLNIFNVRDYYLDFDCSQSTASVVYRLSLEFLVLIAPASARFLTVKVSFLLKLE
jgi:hypothetical protein